MSAVETEAPQNAAEKIKTIQTLTKSLDKEHGANSLVRLGSKVGIPIASLSTGLAAVDYEVIGCGGLPKGRIIEVFGPESAGKTSFVLHMIAQTQRNGGVAAMVDAEHALDPNWAKRLGVDVDNLFVSQPDFAEQGLQIVDALVDSKACDLIVIDSVAALVPKAELEGEIGDAHVGQQARLMGQAMRILSGKTSKTGCIVLFINQIREKVGVMYGNPEVTPGGRALKFFSSVRLDIRRREAIKNGSEIIGHELEVKGVKNKCGAPFRSAKVSLMYETGFDTVGSTVDLAVTRGIIKVAGASYSFNNERIAVGKDKLVIEVKDNPKLFEDISKELKKGITV